MPRAAADRRPIREPSALPEPRSDVGFAIRHLMQTFRQVVDTEVRARGLDLSFSHVMVLKNLAREPGLSGAQLARRATVTAQSMNGLLHSMESLALIVREKHPENKRTDSWFMTRTGLKQIEQTSGIVDEILAGMLAKISKSDAARFASLLHQCADALQEGAPAPRASSARAAKGSKAALAKMEC